MFVSDNHDLNSIDTLLQMGAAFYVNPRYIQDKYGQMEWNESYDMAFGAMRLTALSTSVIKTPN